MKIKRNKKSYKWFLCGLIMVVVLTISYRVSKANYRISNSIELTTGKVVSSPYDFNIVSVYIDGVEQSKDATMPGKGYVLTSDSYCYRKNKEEKDITVILETNKYGEHIIGELSKSSKCVLYFERKEGIDTASKYILSKITEVTHRKRGTFNIPLEETTTGKIYADSDDDGVTYYYAGNPQDNWVLFGGYYWRIIRINGDGTIRMIYQGTEPNLTGEGTQIGTSIFNPNYGDNTYVGYMYGTPGSSTYEETHANTNDSTIKQFLDNWYENISGLKNYEQYIDKNAGFCGDRQSSSTITEMDNKGGFKQLETLYGGYIRLLDFSAAFSASSINPTFNCPNKNDLYTYNVSIKGNKALINPIGLINADEVVYAGISSNTRDDAFKVVSNYIFIRQNFWTMTPYIFSVKFANYANMFIVNNEGLLTTSNGNYSEFANGIRPVINLRSDVTLTGDGTQYNPFKVIS